MNNSKIKKTITVFAIADIVLALLYGGLFFAVSRKNAQTSEIYSSFYRRTSDAETLKRMQRSLDDTEKQRTLLDEHLITPAQTLNFIEQIENLGKKTLTDVQVTSITSPKKQGEPFILEFTASGLFGNIYRLSSLVEEMPYRITIRKASFSESKTKETASFWRASFTIVLESYLMP